MVKETESAEGESHRVKCSEHVMVEYMDKNLCRSFHIWRGMIFQPSSIWLHINEDGRYIDGEGYNGFNGFRDKIYRDFTPFSQMFTHNMCRVTEYPVPGTGYCCIKLKVQRLGVSYRLNDKHVKQ